MDENIRFMIQEKIKYCNTLINFSLAFFIVCVTVAGIVFPFQGGLLLLKATILAVTIVVSLVLLRFMIKKIVEIRDLVVKISNLNEKPNDD